MSQYGTVIHMNLEPIDKALHTSEVSYELVDESDSSVTVQLWAYHDDQLEYLIDRLENEGYTVVVDDGSADIVDVTISE